MVATRSQLNQYISIALLQSCCHRDLTVTVNCTLVHKQLSYQED